MYLTPRPASLTHLTLRFPGNCPWDKKLGSCHPGATGRKLCLVPGRNAGQDLSRLENQGRHPSTDQGARLRRSSQVPGVAGRPCLLQGTRRRHEAVPLKTRCAEQKGSPRPSHLLSVGGFLAVPTAHDWVTVGWAFPKTGPEVQVTALGCSKSTVARPLRSPRYRTPWAKCLTLAAAFLMCFRG